MLLDDAVYYGDHADPTDERIDQMSINLVDLIIYGGGDVPQAHPENDPFYDFYEGHLSICCQYLMATGYPEI